MLNKTISNYLSTAMGLPFFYVVDDNNYSSILLDFKQSGVRIIQVSDFCSQDDKFPNIDNLKDSFHTADVDYKTNKYVLIGLGEYLALRGEEEALKVLRDLKSTNLGVAKVVILLRYVTNQVETLLKEDIRLKNQRILIDSDDSIDTSVTNIHLNGDFSFVQKTGIKYLLQQYEEGKHGKLFVKTSLDISKSIFPISNIENSFDGIGLLSDKILLKEEFGNDEQWSKLLAELLPSNSIIDVLQKNGLYYDLENDFIDKAFGLEYKNWLYFISLKINDDKLHNKYLKYVLNKTDNFINFRNNILNAIIDINHLDKQFDVLYDSRKKLLKNIHESDIVTFIRKNEVDYNESIYKFTDNTIKEKQAIIQWVSKYGLVPELQKIYPSLHSYLKKYVFDCGKISEQLTEYFNAYKYQKVINRVEESFAEKVCEKSKLYASLDTRANIISSISDKNSSYLCWVDALGVEYLSYILDAAKRKGLSVKINIARADLPTITVINKAFYEEWNGSGKCKISELDEIKHKEKGGFDYCKNNSPIHLANELSVIENVINMAVTELTSHSCKKFIIASDHGSSRLAVISQFEEKYETDTKGEHSGRCCKIFDEYDIQNVISENGYLVLTDYGRFKGSRAANVEVHGGGTLEETVIPIITLTLNNQIQCEVVVLNKDQIVVDRNKGISILLYISDVAFPQNVRIVIKDKYYEMEMIDKTHYKATIDDIKHSGKYKIDVFDGTNMIDSIMIQVKGAVGSAKSDFDELF